MPRPRIDLPDGLSAEEHEARRRERGFNAGIYAVSIGLTRTTYLNKVRHHAIIAGEHVTDITTKPPPLIPSAKPN